MPPPPFKKALADRLRRFHSSHLEQHRQEYLRKLKWIEWMQGEGGECNDKGPREQCPLDKDHPWMRERWRMQRRMFLWFGATILLTLVVVVGVMRMVIREGPPICKEESQIRHFHQITFERVWDNPVERAWMARQWHTEFGTTLRLLDASGNILNQYGDAPCDKPRLVIDVGPPELPKGQVVVCYVNDPYAAKKAQHLGLALMVAGCVVWAISGVIARRVAGPLTEITRVAQDIGAGKYSSRINAERYKGEVGVLGYVLNDMAERVERQMADQRALLAAVSHEIRTPLARLRILAEMARDKSDDQKTIDKIDAEVVEIDQLVSELLANSRIDFSALNVSPLDARLIATDALERADVDPTVLSFEAAHPQFRGDPTLVARAVLNLIENAKRHGGGVTEVRVYEEGERIFFEVHDEGPGLDETEAEKIFQPFYRGRNSSERSVGLGLALVRRIAQAHGGDAYAHNRPEGRGACVGVSFSSTQAPYIDPSPSRSRQATPAIALRGDVVATGGLRARAARPRALRGGAWGPRGDDERGLRALALCGQGAAGGLRPPASPLTTPVAPPQNNSTCRCRGVGGKGAGGVRTPSGPHRFAAGPTSGLLTMQRREGAGAGAR